MTSPRHPSERDPDLHQRCPPPRWARLSLHALRRRGAPILDALIPQACAACDAWIPGDEGSFCPACAAGIERWSAEPVCPRCARTVSASSIIGDTCGHCRGEAFWNIAGMVRCGRYDQDPMRQLVGRLKFVERQRPAELLGALLAERIRAQRWAGELDAVVPVPMHWLRRAQRPCDHARLLAEAVARWLRLPVKVAVRRIRYAPSQANLPSRQRRFESVLGCFAPARFADVRGLTVCIIDNLVVSGATVCEVSKALRRAGAANIYVAVAARSAMPNERQPAAGQVLAPGSCANAAPRPVLDP